MSLIAVSNSNPTATAIIAGEQSTLLMQALVVPMPSFIARLTISVSVIVVQRIASLP